MRAFPFEERRGGLLGPVIVNKVPVGVAAGIIPWNVPLFIMAMKLGPAMAAGVPLVLKPAPETPLDAYLLAEAVIEAGLPPGVVSIVAARTEGSEYLVHLWNDANPATDAVHPPTESARNDAGSSCLGVSGNFQTVRGLTIADGCGEALYMTGDDNSFTDVTIYNGDIFIEETKEYQPLSSEPVCCTACGMDDKE